MAASRCDAGAIFSNGFSQSMAEPPIDVINQSANQLKACGDIPGSFSSITYGLGVPSIFSSTKIAQICVKKVRYPTNL